MLFLKLFCHHQKFFYHKTYKSSFSVSFQCFYTILYSFNLKLNFKLKIDLKMYIFKTWKKISGNPVYFGKFNF